MRVILDMNRSFRPTFVRPNMPLRKPLSSPNVNDSSPPPPVPSAMPATLAGLSSGGDFGNGSPLETWNSTLSSSALPALTVYACNYCGQPGNLRCKRCKKMHYCSVVCQAEDWKAHRPVCKPVDPEPAKEKPKENASLSDGTHLPASMSKESASYKRVYLKDLYTTEVIMGPEIQATVVEVYSPSRFFLLHQNPEVLEALQNISTGLQEAFRNTSVSLYVPCVGEVCTAQFSSDLNWYRGLVQTLSADQKMANILYIDFGNEEDVPVDRIRPLPTNIQLFRPCAMACQIAGVVPVLNQWSDECCVAMKQLLAGKIVTVKLLETLDNGHIHAVDLLLSAGKQLSAFLLQGGYAQKCTISEAPTEEDVCAMLATSLKNFQRFSDGKDDNKWAQPPEPIKQFVGDQLSVFITHLQSPNDLIVQKVDNAGLVQDLQLKLREHCSQVAASPNFRPAPETVCCSQFSEDKQWYRAKVLAYPSEQRIIVGYLDFGNSEEVALSQLRPISPPLLALPMQAMHCSLAEVQPNGQSWSKECVEALQLRVLNRILNIEILGEDKGKFLVSMSDETSDPVDNIATLLIAAGYAAPALVTTIPTQAEEKTASAAQIVSEPLVWSSAELPSDGQKVVLLPIVVESPGKFYCQQSTELEKLKELGAQLKQHCEADATAFVPKVGEPCCAQTSGEGAWYRTMVTSVHKDSVAVSLVDYGYNKLVKRSHLRPITAKLLVLPFQAVCCWLAGVEPVGSEWSSEAILWFQTLVDNEQLTARVLSFTEQGYGVELESRGQNVAATLLCEQLVKPYGECFKEPSPVKVSSMIKQEDGVKEHEYNVQANNQTETCSSQSSEMLTAVTQEVASFPVDWKTVELPLKEVFQPCITAVINPSLFYLLCPAQVDQQKLQEVMEKLAVYCGSNKDNVSAAEKCKPAPGSACCAQFSADNNWYRAVVLSVGENEMSVLYADYGNSEKVPHSRILPIPTHLLALPFQIARGALAGKEHFPSDWPEEVQQVFQSELANGVLASVQSFDGSANVLCLTRPAVRGGGDLTAMMLDTLHAHSKSSPHPNASPSSDRDGCFTSPSTSSVPAGPKPPSHTELGNAADTSDTTKPSEPTAQSISAAPVSEDPVKKDVDQIEPQDQNSSTISDHQTSSCCCQSLKKQIDNLEHLIKQLLDRQ
nr:tudor domain-containing protein 1 isoform X1 [Nothobranchius furzeri]